MTRFAIDAPVALRLIRDGRSAVDEQQLVAPALLRSDVLAQLYTEVRSGGLDEKTARRHLEGLTELRIRLLGDRVSRATAWKIAIRLDWPLIGPAEYLAVASLQADVLVTEDARLIEGATGIVATVPYAELRPFDE